MHSQRQMLLHLKKCNRQRSNLNTKIIYIFFSFLFTDRRCSINTELMGFHRMKLRLSRQIELTCLLKVREQPSQFVSPNLGARAFVSL